jgi:hypothetical protein
MKRYFIQIQHQKNECFREGFIHVHDITNILLRWPTVGWNIISVTEISEKSA